MGDARRLKASQRVRAGSDTPDGEAGDSPVVDTCVSARMGVPGLVGVVRSASAGHGEVVDIVFMGTARQVKTVLYQSASGLRMQIPTLGRPGPGRAVRILMCCGRGDGGKNCLRRPAVPVSWRARRGGSGEVQARLSRSISA
ncbi:hypothetical protein GCM10011289_25770 [Paludibacterium paludis]|uniref:Uncharacterized protein n=1 Tax=Paludibacterium paludis TaxID=1225769 RepID=A0A918UAC5_9NEIS|nr:hypothetical protein GCM10011289_25770 [Paludibacterium paludis]